MTFNEIRNQLKAVSRGANHFTQNKKLDALITQLQKDHPEYFYSEKDERLNDRVFVHNPFSVPHKRYLFEEAYERQGDKWIAV